MRRGVLCQRSYMMRYKNARSSESCCSRHDKYIRLYPRQTNVTVSKSTRARGKPHESYVPCKERAATLLLESGKGERWEMSAWRETVKTVLPSLAKAASGASRAQS